MRTHHRPTCDECPRIAPVFRTLHTLDGPFTIVVDHTGAVVASGWVSSPAAALRRIRHFDESHLRGAAQISAGGKGADGGWETASPSPPRDDKSSHRMVEGLNAAARAVEAYYLGDYRAPMTVPVHQEGTEFQLAVWGALRSLTPSAIHTYTDLAARAGNAAAVRAAASACARNAAGLFVPCHRVRRADGEVGNFAWGSERKVALLERELGPT